MIFVDAGPFLARHLRNDQLHQRATRAWKDLGRSRSPLVTSNFVLDETFTLLARRASYAFAADRAEVIYSSRILTVLRPDAADEQGALTLFRKLADQEVSFTDCVSFVLMRRHGLSRAFTFDRHFSAAGFTVWP